MSQLSDSEWFNLAVGVYAGFVEAFNRVKPIPRTSARIDFVEMLKASHSSNVGQAVDYFCRRFLSVEMAHERREAIIDFLKTELEADQLEFDNPRLPGALRRAAHLIMSAPEYQAD